MDDLFIDPERFDLFSEPALAMVTFGWLALLLLLRRVAPRAGRILLGLALAAILLTAADPVFEYAATVTPVAKRQTEAVLEAGSADPIRERDPVFALLGPYRREAAGRPLTVIDDPNGEGLRWARYYVHPHPVLNVDPAALATSAPAEGEGPLFVLSRGMPAVPATLAVEMVERHGEWMLFRVSRSDL